MSHSLTLAPSSGFAPTDIYTSSSDDDTFGTFRFADREGWLNYLVERMRVVFDHAGQPLPTRIRCAFGFPSTGKRGGRIGECWNSTCSDDAHFEIMIRPDQSDARRVGAILLHELCHAACGIAEGHGPVFGQLARKLGLEGPLTATTGGPRLWAWLDLLLADAGPMPHAKLNWSKGTSTAPPKQTTRMIKLECSMCGYIARTTAKWILEVGAAHCPAHGEMRVCD